MTIIWLLFPPCDNFYCLETNFNMFAAAAAAAKSLQSCLTLCDPIDGSPPGSPRIPRIPWDSPGKNTGVGFHFLLQCMKVKSENEVTQLCLTLSELMNCSLPGSSVHGIFQARVLEWGAIDCASILWKRLKRKFFFWLTHVINKRREKWVTNWKILKVIKSEHTVGQPHSWPRNLPGRTHKASAVVAVGVQAVPVCNPHTADLVPVGS